jgi:hypothetical protein
MNRRCSLLWIAALCLACFARPAVAAPILPFTSDGHLNALTATFRAEVQQTHPDIQFSLVSPGVVRTEFGLNARHGGPDSRQLPDSSCRQRYWS